MKKQRKNNDIVYIKVNIRRARTILFLIAIIFFINNTVLAKENIQQKEELSYTVNQGDTLWNIAKDYRRGNEDIRQTVKRITTCNNLKDATIYPGQEIKIEL